VIQRFHLPALLTTGAPTSSAPHQDRTLAVESPTPSSTSSERTSTPTVGRESLRKTVRSPEHSTPRFPLSPPLLLHLSTESRTTGMYDLRRTSRLRPRNFILFLAVPPAARSSHRVPLPTTAQFLPVRSVFVRTRAPARLLLSPLMLCPGLVPTVPSTDASTTPT